MIIAVLNQKGGVGKTTTAINLAAALAEGTPFKGTSGRGQATSQAVSVVQVLDADSQQQALGFTIPHVQIRAAQSKADLQSAIADSASSLGSSTWTIIDCPPSLIEAAPAIPLADLILAPVPPRFQDLSGFARLRETVDAARERGNPHLQLQVLVTMRDARVTLQAEYEAQFRAAFGDEVLASVIPRTALFERAASAHQSVLQFAPSSPAAQAYRAAAQEIQALSKAFNKALSKAPDTGRSKSRSKTERSKRPS